MIKLKITHHFSKNRCQRALFLSGPLEKRRQTMNNTSYPYKLSWSLFLIVFVLFSFCTIFLASIALSNKSGLMINRLLYLSANAATNFYWLLSLLSASFVLAILWVMTRGIGQKRVVILICRISKTWYKLNCFRS